MNGDLGINNNDSLTDLDGLRNLDSVEGVWIGYEEVVTNGGTNYYYSGNDALGSVQGLNKLTSVGGKIHISSNSSLTSLDGLNNVSSIAEGLWIYSTALTSLKGLDSLTTVGETVHIYSNAVLTSLELDRLDRVGGNFWILNNPSLPTALITGLRDQVLVGGGIGEEIIICGNQGGSVCN